MQRMVWWLITMVGLLLGGLILYNAFWPLDRALPARKAEPQVQAPPAAARVEAQVQQPVRDMATEKPMPELDGSDTTMVNAIAGLFADQAVMGLLNNKDVVRRIVITVDNLPQDKIPARFALVKPVGGKFAVNGANDSATIAPENAARYAKYVRVAESLNGEKWSAFYFRAYPLFQQMYRELGYPQGHFNDRLVGVIDHLLATPELSTPVALVRPKVFYRYADAKLETRSAGQKLLMRMGAENAARIKAKLREVRVLIASRPPPIAESGTP